MNDSASAYHLRVVTVLVVPLLATFLMESAEALVESLGWRIRLGRTGWDLCVLAVGSTGGIFTMPEVVKGLGAEWSVTMGVVCLIVAIACGLFNIHLRKTPKADVKGWQSLLSVGLGIAALALPWYYVIVT